MMFQYIELLLKELSANESLSGYVSELKTNLEQRTADFHKKTSKKTLGQVAELFLKNNSTSEETTNVPNELKGVWVSSQHTIKFEDDFLEAQKNVLDSLVAERNELIHHLLSKWNPTSFESGTAIEHYLDKQREKILPEIELLEYMYKSVQEARQAAAQAQIDFMATDEFKLLWLKRSLLVATLIDIARQRARPDGWVVLASAAHFIRQNIPEEVANLKERYGHKKLEGIILATEYFEIMEEQTDKGGIRLLYRIKHDLNIDEALEDQDAGFRIIVSNQVGY